MSAGGRHLHHSTFGIFGLLGIGFLWAQQVFTGHDEPPRWGSRITATTYGIAAALTLDEFALWLDLHDDYWDKQGRKSIDAVAIFGGLPLALLAYVGYLFVPLGHGGIIQPSCAALGGLVLARLVLKEPLPGRRIAGALAISKGVVAKYVARIERTGLEPGVLMSMSDAEVMARIAPPARPVSYGGRVKPDFAHLHAELKRPNVTLMLLWEAATTSH